MMYRLLLSLLPVIAMPGLNAQTKKVCEAALVVRWENMPFQKSKTDSLDLPSKTSTVCALLRSDKLAAEILLRNKKPTLKENIVRAQKSLSVSAHPQTGLIELGFVHSDTQYAKRFMDTLVKVLPVMYWKDRTQLVDKKTALLDKEIELLRINTGEVNEAFKNWMGYNSVLDLDKEKQLVMDRFAGSLLEKEKIEKTMEAHYFIEGRVLTDEVHAGNLLAWADGLSYDTLFAKRLVAYAGETGRTQKEMAGEILVYIKESRMLLTEKKKDSEKQMDHYRSMLTKMNKLEPEYRLMRTKLDASQKSMALLMQRKTELLLYKASIHMGEIEVMRAPGIR